MLYSFVFIWITKRLEDVEQKTQDQRLEDPELAASLCSAPGLALADTDAPSAHLPCHIIMYHSNISPVMSFPSAQKRNHQQLHAPSYEATAAGSAARPTLFSGLKSCKPASAFP
jgi:hypothetical protein